MIPIQLPKEQKDQIIRLVQSYFEEERSETIGGLAAEQLIDFMITQLGPYLYNKAIDDARKMLTQRMVQIDDDLYTLEQPVMHARGDKR
jgi:uncharacterized protein (DUF2164 family)